MQRPSNNPLGDPFGYVPGYPLNGGYHMGQDFNSTPDPVIYAPEDGTYDLVPDNGSLGNAIHMYTGNRHHAFGHTSKYLIEDNQFVTRGTPIAIMGDTGAAYGVHLHWALAINGGLVNPLSQVNEEFIGGNNVAIIENADNWRGRAQRSFQAIRGRDMGTGEFEPWVGQDFLHLIEALEDNDETNVHIDNANLGAVARRDNWEQQIYTLQDQVKAEEAKNAELQKQLDAANSKPPTGDTALAKDTNNKITSVYNYFVGQFKTFAKYIKKG